jgi:hypothetical protein
MRINDTVSPPLPPIFVGKDIINQRVKLFMQNKHPLLSEALTAGGTPREETRTIWYSKEHVATWLNEMELMNADGMRVYFGAYGNEENRPVGQMCLLMVLTRAGADGQSHKDIILEREPDFDTRVQAGLSRSRSFGDGNDEGKPREYNYGAPCPPICAGNDPAFPED